MGWLGQDVRQALRLLSSNTGFAVATLLTLALAVGGAGVMFAAVYGVLVRPLPYPEPDRLVRLWEVHPGAQAPFDNDLLSAPTYRAWAPASTTLEAIGSARVTERVVRGAGASQRIRSASLTPSMFRVLRVTPARGRFFTDADAVDGAPPVVVIADALWRARFGGDPAAIGSAIVIDEIEHEIIGIAPAGFRLPEAEVALVTPLAVPPVEAAGKAIGILAAFARLEPGATLAQAEAEGTSYARSVDRPYADLVFGRGRAVEVRVRPLVDQMTRQVQPALLVLAAGVGLLLLVASANVANLLLARNSARAREFAVRAALGASRARLVRQLVTESLVIALIGGTLGAAIGWVLTAVLPALAPASIPRLDQIRADAWFLAAAACAAALAGVLAGVAPAMASSRTVLAGPLHAGGRSVGSPGRRIRHALLIVEAALAVVLLVGAALLGRSFAALLGVDAGYEPGRVFTADVSVPGGADVPRRMTRLASAVVERLRQAPGVRAAGAGSMAPFGGSIASSGFALPGMTTADGQPVVAKALQAVITPGYAEALGMRLTEGRFFRAADATSPVIAMLVSERFARAYFTDGKPATGRRFVGMFPRMLGRTDAVVEVVGVVGDVLPDRLDGRPQPQIYVPAGVGFDLRGATLIVRAEGSAASVASLVRRTVDALEPGATLARMGPLTAKISESVSEPRFAAVVLAGLATLALALATTGLYGVLSYDVAQRRREIGVRGALGATRANLVGMVLREGLALTATGLVLGIGASALVTRLLTNVLFGVLPLDGVALFAAPLMLLLVASVACLVPARRAAQIDPAEALRGE